MFSYNLAAVSIIKQKVLPRTEELRIGAWVLRNGATVVDMGINYPGSWSAAQLFVEIGLGGRGEVKYSKMKIGDYLVPTVCVYVTHPVVTEMSSHVAYWKLQYQGQDVVISGPIRAIQAPDVFSRAVSYRDTEAGCGVAMIQSADLPDEGLAEVIADGAKIPVENLYLVVARTGSLVGAVQVAARNVEQTLPSLYDRGFNLGCIVQAWGLTPIIAVVDNEIEAYGRVNDCLLYGQETNLWVDCQDEEIERVLADLPFSKNTDIYGIPFKNLFIKCGSSWAKVPREWDAPARVNFFNLRTGHRFTAGRINNKVLLKDFLGEED
ncbi:methenyltetrahydromethanopterin cyclohydrolase [Moorellaceae bacterium AZ2]